MIKNAGLIQQTKNLKAISTTMTLTDLKQLIKSDNLKEMTDYGLSTETLSTYEDMEKSEFLQEFIIVVGHKNIQYEKVDVKSDFKAYQIAQNNMVIFSLKNKSCLILKGFEIFDKEKIESCFGVVSEEDVIPLKIIIEKDDFDYDALFCSFNNIQIDKSKMIARDICENGALKKTDANYSLVDIKGKTISARSSSIFLFNTILYSVNAYRKTHGDENLRNAVNDIWICILNDLKVFHDSLKNPKLIPKYREKEHEYSLLMKTSVHSAIFDLFSKYIHTDNYSRLVSFFNENDFSAKEKWVNVLIDSRGNVLSRNKDLFVEYVEKELKI